MSAFITGVVIQETTWCWFHSYSLDVIKLRLVVGLGYQYYQSDPPNNFNCITIQYYIVS